MILLQALELISGSPEDSTCIYSVNNSRMSHYVWMKACDKASAVLEVTVSSYEVDKVLSTVDDSPGILYFFFVCGA